MTTVPIQTSDAIFVIGAGIMGAGIAQVAAQAGHPVMLFDTREGAASDAIAKLTNGLAAQVAKGKMTDEAARGTIARISPVGNIGDAATARMAIEAIVENLEAKQQLLRQLEEVVDDACVLASNTSSISITALANGLKHPERLVGMHFFNPVPAMKLVEVVSGLRTSPQIADAVLALAGTWGKVGVHARSTPGFIVNRIARPYYAETLSLLQERAAEPAALDACLRGAGFRMGPCELMDLIGHDTNFAVTQSVFDANFGDKRFAPSLVQRELVDGGLLGRKSGRGFFDYAAAASLSEDAAVPERRLPKADGIVLHGENVAVERWVAALDRDGMAFARNARSEWIGLETPQGQLRLTDGRSAALVAVRERVREVALFDLPIAHGGGQPGSSLAWTVSGGASANWTAQAEHWIALAGWTPRRMADAGGLVVARTIAMLINEAADAVLQGVCTQEAADAAMKLGVNYPAGPFEWLAAWDIQAVVTLLDHLDNQYRGERYRVSRELRQRAWLREGGQ
jgi:3-hydroxybutyryl-CoA dehydrogenase